MEEQPLDLKATFKAVKRHRLLVALMLAAGLCVGVGYVERTPPLPEARALVLLPPTALTGSPGTSPFTQTQEIIATSARVLSTSGTAVFPPMDAASLVKDVTVTAPSQDVLQIAVRAHTIGSAERLADAVATNYIAFVDGTANGSEQLLAQLQRQATQLTEQILRLQREIVADQARLKDEQERTPAGERDLAQLDSFRDEQNQLSLQLSNVNVQIVNAEVASAQTTSATQLLQPAEPVVASGDRVPQIALLGALAGLVSGAVLALSLTRRDRRLRSRDAIATAIGVPVVASMWAKRCKKVGDWRRLLERSATPSPVEAWNARRAFQRLIRDGHPSALELRLLAFSGDDAAMAAGAKIAGAAAALGMRTRLEVGAQPALSVLRAACVVIQGPTSGTAMADLEVGSTASTELAGLTANVRLEAIDPAKPEIGPSNARTLLVVSSGFATVGALASAALAASEAGSPVSGLLVTNPDPDDSTAGLLPGEDEPLHVALRSLNGHRAPELARTDPE